MNNQVITMFGVDITDAEPIRYNINITLPADKYTGEQVEELAETLNNILCNNKIYHEEPYITNLYEIK